MIEMKHNWTMLRYSEKHPKITPQIHKVIQQTVNVIYRKI